MTKKCFAAIKASQETMAEIESLAQSVMDNPTDAYNTMKRILEISASWNKDFKDVDPAWQPPDKDREAAQPKTTLRERAIAMGAFVQEGI